MNGPAEPQVAGCAIRESPPDLRSIIRSKVQPPALRPTTLSRVRLLDRLEASLVARVTLLTAEAGYGKTTLLGDFTARTTRRCIWYRLDSTDRDWVTLVNYLASAVREVLPTFGDGPTGVLAQVAAGDVPRDVVVGRLVADLGVLDDAPSVLILDDYHEVDGSDDLADLMQRLLRDGPPSLRVVIAGRVRPSLPLARLASAGDVAEMTTEDLRFSRAEIGQLFAETYDQPLESDVVDGLDRRTEGWAASLQLFHSSVRGRSSSDVRSAADALTGTAQPLYDYLAQEVLGGLSRELRDFLLRASILERITPETAGALFDDEAAAAEIPLLIEEGDRLGLLHRSARDSDVRQLHPLLRAFLGRDLVVAVSATKIREMHRRVAAVLRSSAPLAAAHHLIEAGQQDEAMRLLGDSVLTAVGSGQWGAASELVGRLGGVVPVPAVITIQARRLLDEGRAEAAAALIRDIDVSDEPPDVRAAFWLTLVNAGWRSGDSEAQLGALRQLADDREIDESFRALAGLYRATIPPRQEMPLPELAMRLEQLADMQLARDHHYFAAISLHNAATAAAYAAHFQDALTLSDRALALFEQMSPLVQERCSTYALRAMCFFELGRVADAGVAIEMALKDGIEQSDVPAEIARLLAIVGDINSVAELLSRARALEKAGIGDPLARAVMNVANAAMLMAEKPAEAIQLLSDTSALTPVPTGLDPIITCALATALTLDGQYEAAARVADASLRSAQKTEAGCAVVRAQLALAIADRDARLLDSALEEACRTSQLALLEQADAIGPILDLIGDRRVVEESVAKWPKRWMPVLRRQLTDDVPAARIAAELLDAHGQASDVALLRAFARTYVRRGRLPGLGRKLARRTSPVLRIHDLGRVRLTVGDRSVVLGEIRRKAAALLMYLVTRPNQTATREQVMDDLWPDADPASAINSLNQSLYFLRRDIDPWFEDDVSADYIAFQGDLVWLDEHLVSVASREFVERSRRILAGEIEASAALEHVRSYRGMFSPEFEYEEWAIGWRSRVHATFLEFAQKAVDTVSARGDLATPRDIAIDVLSVDPTAAEMEQRLITLYWKLGARSAATAQYGHYAARERSDGLPVTELAHLIGEG